MTSPAIPIAIPMKVGDLMELARALGGLPVFGCLAGSPAEQAGIRYGDVLLSVDGMPTGSVDDYLAARSRSGRTIVVRVFRAGLELDFELGLRDPLQASEVAASLPDLRFEPDAEPN